ncbi:DUF268 domain-containing protein [Geobacter sp. SVR]|uniref:DUF268 domain-containing protein n=1 Tax=Geobacter sp. SVR TaxID=2495594 RepID=UPI00143EFA26|nr:DUF268 domain-containing protein [Geobacter sp. SVR]BCS51976.1 hypothetical protein GSVR_02840 [Geobacter sp. SVR]GCF87209.1 hypothetical protein GSbR_38090 [Geobacter sp. SVR]
MKLLRKMNFLLFLAGLNLQGLASFLWLMPKYARDFLYFKKQSDWKIAAYPCLYDTKTQSATLGEYFWQDMYVAGKIINSAQGGRHIDIGSRVDGFISIVASVRPIEVFDIRPLKVKIPNVEFHQWDMTVPSCGQVEADSVSCLHTIEHVGLGRYGDRIDPDGWKCALINVLSLLKENGVLWLSVPIGIERVEFNAHRIFNPHTIDTLLCGSGMELLEFSYVDGTGLYKTENTVSEMMRLAHLKYSLGIFCYRKIGKISDFDDESCIGAC